MRSQAASFAMVEYSLSSNATGVSGISDSNSLAQATLSVIAIQSLKRRCPDSVHHINVTDLDEGYRLCSEMVSRMALIQNRGT